MTGVSIMRMEEKLDTGPVLAARAIEIGSLDTGGTLHDRLAALGGDLIRSTMDDLAAGRAVEAAQPQDGVTYAEKISKAEAFIDWREDAEQVLRKVRAFNPAPVAETRWNGDQLRIWEAEAARTPGLEGSDPLAPGSVVSALPAGIEVACGRGGVLRTGSTGRASRDHRRRYCRRSIARRPGCRADPRPRRHARCCVAGDSPAGASRARAAGSFARLRRGARVLSARGHFGPVVVAAGEVTRFSGTRAPIRGAVRAGGCTYARIRRRGCGGKDGQVDGGRARRRARECGLAALSARAQRAGRGHRAKSRPSACLPAMACGSTARRLAGALDPIARRGRRPGADVAARESPTGHRPRLSAVIARGGHRRAPRAPRAARARPRQAPRRPRSARFRGWPRLGTGSRCAMRGIPVGPRAGPQGARRLRRPRGQDRAHGRARAGPRSADGDRHRLRAPHAGARESRAGRPRRPGVELPARGGTALRSIGSCWTLPVRRSA
jgi:hypothetical protein